MMLLFLLISKHMRRRTKKYGGNKKCLQNGAFFVFLIVLYFVQRYYKKEGIMSFSSKMRSLLSGRTLVCTGLLTGLFALYVCVVLINVNISSNIAFAGTLLPELSEWLYLAIELLAFFTAYALVLFAYFTDGGQGLLVTSGAYVITTLIRHSALLFLGMSEAWATAANLIPELIQFGVIVLVCYFSVVNFDKTYAIMQKGASKMGVDCPARLCLVFPNGKRPFFKDPFCRAAFESGMLVSIIRVIGRLIYDFMVGAPDGIVDALWMLLYYGVDILIGVGGGAWMLTVIRLLGKTEKSAG